MDRGAWQAAVHGVPRVGHDIVTKPPAPRVFILDSVLGGIKNKTTEIKYGSRKHTLRVGIWN